MSETRIFCNVCWYIPLLFPSRKRPLDQDFLCLDFFLFSLKCFDNIWKRDFLSFLFFTAIVYYLQLSLY